MEKIKDKERLLELTNDLLNDLGEPYKMAEVIDESIFDIIRDLCANNESVSKYDFEKLYILKKIRDLFIKLQKDWS